MFYLARHGISILRYISILRRIHILVRGANRLHKNIMLLRESLMKLNIQNKVFNTCAAIYFFIGGSTYAYIFYGPYSIFSIKYDYQKGTDIVLFCFVLIILHEFGYFFRETTGGVEWCNLCQFFSLFRVLYIQGNSGSSFPWNI